jgi:hypothetical protein
LRNFIHPAATQSRDKNIFAHKNPMFMLSHARVLPESFCFSGERKTHGKWKHIEILLSLSIKDRKVFRLYRSIFLGGLFLMEGEKVEKGKRAGLKK